MTKFYETMPAELPKTLPKGTRSLHCSVAASELILKINSTAAGLDAYWGYWNSGDRKVYNRPEQIDWSSVPLLTQEPVAIHKEPCAACGVPVTGVESYLSFNGQRHLVCATCWLGSASPRAAIRARRAAQDSSGSADGPELDCHCGHAGCSSCDKPTDAPLCSTPACAARGAVATKGERCVYCSDTDRRDDFETMMQMTRYPGDSAAGDRLAAWARAERPRGNPAEAAMLSKPHPWSCDEDV